MPTAPAKPRPFARRRDLLEFVQADAGGPALRIDRDHGVIYGVRVLGSVSENNRVYTRECMESALPMYEGVSVRVNHPADRARPNVERPAESVLGKIRNVRVETDEAGLPVIRGDLHYLRTHEMAESVAEDVERRLGVYGFSHNAASPLSAERVDPKTGRLVISRLALVRSVDLVDGSRAATSRTLWESVNVDNAVTRRSLLESYAGAILGKTGREKLLRVLLEDEYMSEAAAAPMDAPPADGAEPEDKLWAGFQDAITAILGSYKESGDAETACKKIARYVKAHAKLTGDAEPDGDELDEPADPPEEKPDASDKKESVELERLRTKDAVRNLCESLDFAPKGVQLSALIGLPDDKSRRELIESFRAGGGPKKFAPTPPRSGAAGGKSGKAPTVDAAADLAALRG